jgi:xanthine/uracil permease
MLEGEKTRVFWWGLIIFGLALSGLFATLWYIFIFSYGDYYWRFFAPLIFGSIIFLLIGLYMMKSGVRKEKETRSGPKLL